MCGIHFFFRFYAFHAPEMDISEGKPVENVSDAENVPNSTTQTPGRDKVRKSPSPPNFKSGNLHLIMKA